MPAALAACSTSTRSRRRRGSYGVKPGAGTCASSIDINGDRITHEDADWGVGHRHASAELLGQRDDDARWAADVAEPIAVLVLRHLADEFGAVGAQAGNGVLNVVDGEHDAT